MRKKNNQIDKFIDKVISESKPIERRKVSISKIDMPRKRKIVNKQETGFVCNEFEVILDAESD